MEAAQANTVLLPTSYRRSIVPFVTSQGSQFLKTDSYRNVSLFGFFSREAKDESAGENGRAMFNFVFIWVKG